MKTRFLGLIGCTAVLGLPVLFLLSLSAPARASTYQYTFTGIGPYFADTDFTIVTPVLLSYNTLYAPTTATDLVFGGVDDLGPITHIDFAYVTYPYLIIYSTMADLMTGGPAYPYYVDSLGSYDLPAGTLVISTTTPLPAALPLFASGLGALGLFGWRRKRKSAAALAAA
jgi:hypothetical protein